MKSVFARSASIVACAAFAVPPTPDFFWDQDFDVSEKQGVSLVLNGNALEDNGKSIRIGTRAENNGKGLVIDWSAAPKGAVSVLVKYAHYANPTSDWSVIGCCRATYDGQPHLDHPGVGANAAGTTKGIWEGDGIWNGGGQDCGTFQTGDGHFLFRYKPANNGVSLLQRIDGTWQTVYSCTGLRAEAEKNGTAQKGIHGFAIGGFDSSSFVDIHPASGMKVLGVAVFGSEISIESATDYFFPSEKEEGNVTLQEGQNYVWSTLDWTGISFPTRSDSVHIRVNGNAVLEMDVSSAVMTKCVIEGSGSLTLTGTGMLSSLEFEKSVPLKLTTVTGELTLGDNIEHTGAPAFGNGVIAVSGVMHSPGLSGPGTLNVSNGVFVLRGDEAFTGPVQLGSGSTVITTNGTVGSAGFQGSGRICFQGAMPAVGMLPYFRASTWSGRCQLDRIDGNQADLNTDLYANPNSKTILAGVKGWVQNSVTFTNEVELSPQAWDGTEVVSLDLCDGYSSGTGTVYSKLSGRGALKDSHANRAVKQVIRVLDASGFHGSVLMRVKRFVVGAVASPKDSYGTIYVPAGQHLDGYGEPDTAKCGYFHAANGIFVDGELTVAAPDFFIVENMQSPVTVGDGGIVRFAMNASFNHWPYDNRERISFTMLQGTGRLEFTDYGTGIYRSFPDNTNRMWTGRLEVANLQGSGTGAGIILAHKGTAEEPAMLEINTLSGTGCFRSDANLTGGGEQDRSLRVIQSRDTTWSGVMGGGVDAFAEFHVASAADNIRSTLTMTGINTKWVDTLVVDPTGSIKLDGVWNGDVRVEGVFGGSGTNTNGRLTLESNAIFDTRRGVFTTANLGGCSTNVTVRMNKAEFMSKNPIIMCGNVSEAVQNVPVKVLFEDDSQTMAHLAIRGGGICLMPGGLSIIIR